MPVDVGGHTTGEPELDTASAASDEVSWVQEDNPTYQHGPHQEINMNETSQPALEPTALADCLLSGQHPDAGPGPLFQDPTEPVAVPTPLAEPPPNFVPTHSRCQADDPMTSPREPDYLRIAEWASLHRGPYRPEGVHETHMPIPFILAL